MRKHSLLTITSIFVVFLSGCTNPASDQTIMLRKEASTMAETPDYFLLRPEVELAVAVSTGQRNTLAKSFRVFITPLPLFPGV